MNETLEKIGVGDVHSPPMQPHKQPNETSHESDTQPDETFPQVTESCTKVSETFTPVSKTKLAECYGVSRTALSNWLSKLGDIHSRAHLSTPLVDSNGLVTSFAQAELQKFRELGQSEYETHLRRAQGLRDETQQTAALTVFQSPTQTEFDFDLDAIPVEIVDVAPRSTESLLQVIQLTETTESINNALALSRENAAKLIQRDWLVRKANLIALAKAHAAEDKATYAAVYQNELAKDGLGV